MSTGSCLLGPLRWVVRAVARCCGRLCRQPPHLEVGGPISTAIVVRSSAAGARNLGVRPSTAVARPTQALFGSGGEPPYLPYIELSPDFVSALLKASRPRVLGELLPPFLQQYLVRPDLQALNPSWPIEARLVRALRAGVSARIVLDGQFDKQARSPGLPWDNQIYVVLRCRTQLGGFVTQFLTVYCAVLVGDTGGLEPGSVSHGFPTVSEAEVFLRGARRQWPPELLPHQL